MCSRKEVKKRAWEGLKNYYWKAVLCCLIVFLMGVLSFIPYAVVMIAIGFCFCFSPIVPFLGLIVNGFYGNVLGAGQIKYFLQSIQEGESAPVSMAFSGFTSGYYANSGKIFTFRNLFQYLWSLLLLVPGIIKTYEYWMIPYLVADYPEKEQNEIFSLSKQMMTGNKWRTFLFELSFIGWELLAVITCGIGFLFFIPYYSAARTEWYLTLREECLGISRDSVQNSGDYYLENSSYTSGALTGDNDCNAR